MDNSLTSQSDDKMRFSDEKLYQFHDEFRQHVASCEERFNTSDEKFEKLITSQQKNTEAIASLIEETREVVQLNKDIQGVTRIGKGVQAFLLWVIKWPLIGTGIYAMITWILEHIPTS